MLLHRTRGICMEVLERVHEEAAARGAGILFLGDFWHTRGALPVEPLNEVIARLAGWRQPTLMLPGNHDQVSLGGEVHALTPLAAANPAIHAFDGPALFLGALWLPYRRDRSRLEAALAAATAGGPAAAAAAAAEHGGGHAALQAVFAHTDILGALMNEAYQAHDGLPPSLFPPDIPTYTGHYHKPHTVPGSRITYIGSPYQVSRAEAGQQKRLLLLDRSAGWEVAEELNLDVGPRYFAAAAVPAARPSAEAAEAAAAGAAEAGEEAAADAAGGEAGAAAGAGPEAAAAAAEAAAAPEFDLQLPEGLRPGDRLLLTLPVAAAKQHAKQLRKLEKQGVEIEVISPPEAAATPRLGAAEGLGPLQLWERYCSWQRLPAGAAAAGAELLRRLLTEDGAGRLEAQHTSLQFSAVEVEGYFSFREPVRYDLSQRGLVVVTGQVQDTAEAGVESNGAGKTALMMAPLWALTGSVDARAEGTSAARLLLSDIINDGSKKARVRVEGTVNGQAFAVERTANKKTSNVAFELDGREMTTQENKLTQELIDSHLGAELLGRVVFYGQSDITALLEASDRAFKAELSKLEDLDVWAAAKNASKAELSSRRDALSEAGAALRERRQQAGALEEQLAGLQQQAGEWAAQHSAAGEALQQEAGGLLAQLQARRQAGAAAVMLGQQAAEALSAELAALQGQLAEFGVAADGIGGSTTAELAAAEARLAAAQQRQLALQEEQQRQQFELGAAAGTAAAAQREVHQMREAGASVAELLQAFLQQNPSLAASSAGSSAAAAEALEGLLERQQQQRRDLEAALQRLTAGRVEVAGQESRLTAKLEQAQRAADELAAAQSAAQQLQAQAAGDGGGGAPPALEDAQRQRRKMQRRLAGAQQRLGDAQGLARERRRQLEEYQSLVDGAVISSGEGGGEGSGGDGTAVGSASHKHTEGTVCDRCQQPISRELFDSNVQRLQAAAEAAAAAAARAEQQASEFEQAVEDLDAAVEAAGDWEEQQAALAAAEQAVAAKAGAADAAAVALQEAEQQLAALVAAVGDADAAAAAQRSAGEQLAAAVAAAEAEAGLQAQRQAMLDDGASAAAAEAEADQKLQAAQQRQEAAQAALQQLEQDAADAAAALAEAQQALQGVAQHAERAARLEQQRAQAEQRRRRLQSQLEVLADLGGGQLATAEAELQQASGSAGTSGSGSSGELAGMAHTDVEAALDAASGAARAALASAADWQQRWRWHGAQPNLPARDAALVAQQLQAAEAQVADVERRQAELEGEAALWKQVDDAFLPKGVVNFVVEGVLGDLQAAASRNLSALTSGMTLTLSPSKPSKKKGDADGTIEQIEKLVHVRLPGSLEMRPRSVRQLSGGERRRVALALALGFSELAAQRGRLRSNLIVLDEVMQHLDGEGCLRVAQLLKQLPYESILVVAQAHSLLTQAFDAVDVVVKAGGHSSVEQGSSAAVS
ncbi:ABC transporter (ISS) [Micractinium conductrix]|uniref:ABC transporter (ISS) n=1 Tax=Micractinium conductrix TaxID=554055 RepID=A0A2P6V0B3_9CHLO|nr:ABC transporter (ISS) [Micractinium conductrix]|eukprot:PSC67536.1 ABC transporter (ISS) [Micractinium conductrix]